MLTIGWPLVGLSLRLLQVTLEIFIYHNSSCSHAFPFLASNKSGGIQTVLLLLLLRVLVFSPRPLLPPLRFFTMAWYDNDIYSTTSDRLD